MRGASTSIHWRLPSTGVDSAKQGKSNGKVYRLSSIGTWVAAQGGAAGVPSCLSGIRLRPRLRRRPVHKRHGLVPRAEKVQCQVAPAFTVRAPGSSILIMAFLSDRGAPATIAKVHAK